MGYTTLNKDEKEEEKKRIQEVLNYSEEDKEADYPIRLNHGVMGDSILLLLLET